MTTLAPHAPTTPDRRKGTLWRGLGAVLALAILVAGPPTALAAFVGNPVPDQMLIGGQLTDAAIVGMLAAILWVAWAQLMLVVTVEAIAAVRGGRLPRRIPWCGFQQHLARRLVIAASLLLAGASSVMATASGSAVAAAAENPVASCADAMPGKPAPAVLRGSGRATDVEPAHAEAVRLAHVGSELVEDARTIEPEPERGLWYVVNPPHGQRHDSLWDIAERHLGDGLRWREIYELNKHRPQPDGHQLELPRLIQPGWRLLMPADASGIPDGVAREPATEARTAEMPSHSSAPSSAGTVVIPSAREAIPATVAPPAAPMSAADVTARADARAERADTAPAAADVPVADQGDDEASVPFAMLSLGLGAVACAGLTAELARRRRRAQRHRRPGERLRAHTPEAASVERVLRAANAEITVADLRDALRVLAANCHHQGRPLPDLYAIQLNASGATLLLGADDDDAVAPFAAVGPRAWTLDPDALPTAADSEAADPDDDPVDPYPALVALGVSGEAILLINLEVAGALNIVGATEDTEAILNAIVAELGTSTLASSAQLVLTGCAPELAAVLDAGRVTVLDRDAAVRWAGARRRDVAKILADAGLPGLAAARAARLAPDIWAPAVLIRPSDTEDRVAEPEGAAPHVGVCVVTTGDAGSDDDTGWTLRGTGSSWTLDPLGLAVEPQRLTPSTLPRLTELLDTTIVPAPQPTPADAASAPSPDVVGADVADSAELTASSPPAVAAAIPTPPGTGRRPVCSERSDTAVPRVLVLGPVEIVGVSNDGAPGRLRRATELVSYLALHPGATQFQLDEALWPTCRVSRNTRNPLVSRTRQWLGSDADGQPYLELVGEGGHYNLASGVSCDWHDFCALAKRGLTAGTEGVDDLVAALELVRGRPFLGVNPAAYAWAETCTQDMISAIADVAHALAERCFAADDHRRARWATAKGLAVEPCAELLYRDAIRAAQAVGDQLDVDRLVASLRRQLDDLDPADDLNDDTGDLLRLK